MNRFVSFAGGTLHVAQPSIWKRAFELRSNELVVGTLRFPKIFSRDAVAECDEGKWILRVHGLWKTTISVELPDKGKPIATMELGHFALTNKVKLPHYRVLRLVRNLLRTSYQLKTNMNAAICSLKLQMFARHTGELSIDRRGEEYEELPWLLFLIWFVSIIDQRKNGK